MMLLSTWMWMYVYLYVHNGFKCAYASWYFVFLVLLVMQFKSTVDKLFLSPWTWFNYFHSLQSTLVPFPWYTGI